MSSLRTLLQNHRQSTTPSTNAQVTNVPVVGTTAERVPVQKIDFQAELGVEPEHGQPAMVTRSSVVTAEDNTQLGDRRRAEPPEPAVIKAQDEPNCPKKPAGSLKERLLRKRPRDVPQGGRPPSAATTTTNTSLTAFLHRVQRGELNAGDK